MKNRIKATAFLTVALVLAWGIAFRGTSEAVVPGINELMSVSSTNTQGDLDSTGGVSLSGNGRYTVFASSATNLVPNDTNGKIDIFVRDTATGETDRVNVSSSGSQATNSYNNAHSYSPRISYDGRFVVFHSPASNLAPGANAISNVYVRDRLNNTTLLASTNVSGIAANNPSQNGDISADGRFVVFDSSATNLVTGYSTAVSRVYIKDLYTQEVQLLSKSTTAADIESKGTFPRISCDGGVVAFISDSSTLVPGDTNGKQDIFIANLGWSGNKLENVTINSNGGADNVMLSCNGNMLAFASISSNLVNNDTNNNRDVFSYNRLTKEFERVSLNSQNNQITNGSGAPAISGDGRFIAFTSGFGYDHTRPIVVPYISTDQWGVYVRDTKENTTQIVTVDASGYQAGGFRGFYPDISSDGSYMVYANSLDASLHPSSHVLVSSDVNGRVDIFRSKTGF